MYSFIYIYVCVCVCARAYIYTYIYFFYYFKQIYDYKNKFPTYADNMYRFTLLSVLKTDCRIIMQAM